MLLSWVFPYELKQNLAHETVIKFNVVCVPPAGLKYPPGYGRWQATVPVRPPFSPSTSPLFNSHTLKW